MPETGVLLPIFSLPGEWGIGDLGPSAYQFVRELNTSGFGYWQLLPLNRCGFGNSPYNPISAFALEPLLISLELLQQAGLLDQADLDAAHIDQGPRIDYKLVRATKLPLLEKAANNLIQETGQEKLLSLIPERLYPYLTFATLSELYESTAWYKWNGKHRTYSIQLLRELLERQPLIVLKYAALQIIADEQMKSLKLYSADLGIRLIGDLPLYLSYDSAELWAYQELFKLNPDGSKRKVAGVPPDAFSETGQLWGNPVYDWQKNREQSFNFMLERIGVSLDYFDILRLDHFIGLVNYWELDGAAETAQDGLWKASEPDSFFTCLLRKYPVERFIAEDLGILNPQVCHYRDSLGFSGMIVLQFCFEESVPLPQTFPPQCIIYTGTHDNDTTRGWFETLAPDSPSRKNLELYCLTEGLIDSPEDLNFDTISSIMMKIALNSPCRIAIYPWQDVLGLDSSARLNVPGVAEGNWEWRISGDVSPNKFFCQNGGLP